MLSDLAIKNKRGDIIELIGSVCSGGRNKSFRVIGFWNGENKIYHWYITNLIVPAEIVYPLYRLRWRIELIFKSAKRIFRIDDIPSGNSNIIVNLFLASLIAQAASIVVMGITSAAVNKDKALAITVYRTSAIVGMLKDCIIDVIINPISKNFITILNNICVLLEESYDPNYTKRKTSLAEIYQLLEGIK